MIPGIEVTAGEPGDRAIFTLGFKDEIYRGLEVIEWIVAFGEKNLTQG